MGAHQLILGKLVDVLTDESLDDTHDERYRQKIAALLINEKEYSKDNITARHNLYVHAGNKKAVIKIDFVIMLNEKICMIIKYGPGSIITRHRPALAASRVLSPYQIPVVVVTNGKDADILDGASGCVLSCGVTSIPSKSELKDIVQNSSFNIISKRRAEAESRILYAFEVDGSCPCDDTVCKL